MLSKIGNFSVSLFSFLMSATVFVHSITILCLLPDFLCNKNFAKNFGTHGHTWKIIELDILDYIHQKLNLLDINQFKNIIIKKTKDRIEKPHPVLGISTSLNDNVYLYDPSYIVPNSIYNNKGMLIFPSGYTINPLSQNPLREKLIFISGKNKLQIKFALSRKEHYQNFAKIILVDGNPLDIQRENEVWIYFDQHGVLTTKLGITSVPAIVEQEGLRLKVTEIAEDTWRN